MTAAEKRAKAVLEEMRSTPMRRGALSKRARQMRAEIARVLGEAGIPDVLAQRIAFQLVIKIDWRDLGDGATWQAIAEILRDEIRLLTQRVDLRMRQIIKVLPKLSAAHLERFLEELTRADRRIARTILDAAIEAADPLGTGRRYLAEYRLVARQLERVEPTLARTLANATFKAGMPLDKAMEHLERFLQSVAKQKDNPEVARLLARAGFRADDRPR